MEMFVSGAGKTTTISMLTGMYAPSRGDAWINGMSVKTEMHKIRQNMGICPQFEYARVCVDVISIWMGTKLRKKERCGLVALWDR